MPLLVPFKSYEVALSRVLRVREAREDDAREWRATWRPELVRTATLVSDADWDWQGEIRSGCTEAGRLCIAATSADRLEGLMSLSIASSRLEANRRLVYVAYVAAAPWNRRELREVQEIKGVGYVLVQTAVRLSLDLGFQGRIGLHSKPEVETFYRDKLGLRDLGPEIADDGEWVYFEATPEIARGIL